jgi:hypothetical protein
MGRWAGPICSRTSVPAAPPGVPGLFFPTGGSNFFFVATRPDVGYRVVQVGWDRARHAAREGHLHWHRRQRTDPAHAVQREAVLHGVCAGLWRDRRRALLQRRNRGRNRHRCGYQSRRHRRQPQRPARVRKLSLLRRQQWTSGKELWRTDGTGPGTGHGCRHPVRERQLRIRRS